MFFKPALPVLLNESTMPLIFVPPKGLPEIDSPYSLP